MTRRLNITTGIIVLFIGTFVYITDRPAESTVFINHYFNQFSFYNKVPDLFGQWGNNLPAFIHVFAFSLITAGVAGSKKTDYLKICFFWFFVNCIFELGQKYSDFAIKLIPAKSIHGFFINGTFDYLDIIAFATGAIIAYTLLIATIEEELTI